jgi:hypothetical protein
MLKDSKQLGLEWEAENFARAMELNDMLDACADMPAKRILYQTFTKEERLGLFPEYMRRQMDKEAPTGSLVVPANEKAGISFRRCRGNSTLLGTHYGMATVIGHGGHGDPTRYVVLQPPWQNKEGDMVRFAETVSHVLKVVA